jgi:hypothetical protein
MDKVLVPVPGKEKGKSIGVHFFFSGEDASDKGADTPVSGFAVKPAGDPLLLVSFVKKLRLGGCARPVQTLKYDEVFQYSPPILKRGTHICYPDNAIFSIMV